MGEAFVSRGHFAGRWTAEVLVNEIGRSFYVDRRVGAQFPVGSVLVKKHRDRLSSAPGPVFVMIKREAGSFPAGEDWEYVVTDADGWIGDRGRWRPARGVTPKPTAMDLRTTQFSSGCTTEAHRGRASQLGLSQRQRAAQDRGHASNGATKVKNPSRGAPHGCAARWARDLASFKLTKRKRLLSEAMR